MDQRKVYVQGLTWGMFVAALDRPWLDSPFMFQGFLIQTDAELRQLRDLCDYVFIDVDRCLPSVRDKGLFSGRTVIPCTSKNPGAFRQAARNAQSDRLRMQAFLQQVITDVRLGRSLNTREAKDIVCSLVSNISSAANAALWLTQLKDKDEYTTIHSMNVCVLTLAFCKHLNYSQPDMEEIGLGALLHDIGKTRTPDYILNKPGPLTREEFAVVQRHPEDGYQLILASGGLPPQALAIIRCHHERLSGSGYPQGMHGASISQPILMTAIADVYDAITSDRVYHDGISPDMALQILYRNADSHYGQALVQEFIRCIGIYPIGSLVNLAKGNLAMVLSVGAHSRLSPEVLLLQDAKDQPCRERWLVDLAALHEADASAGWKIRRMVNAENVSADIRAIILEELARL